MIIRDTKVAHDKIFISVGVDKRKKQVPPAVEDF